MAFYAVTDGPIDQIVTRKLPAIRSRIRVLIVHDDDNQWQPFDCSHVECLMESAGGGSPIADCGRANRGSIPFEASCQQGARHHGDQRSQVADHRLISLARIAAMDVPITTATQSGARSKV